MKTLTITEARKNLGRCLEGAVRGEDIGIICGAQIIALRRVEVESTDYAQREYGVTPKQVVRVAKAVDRRYRQLKRAGKLRAYTERELRALLE